MKKGEKERWKMSNARKKYEKQSKERMTNEVIDERTMECIKPLNLFSIKLSFAGER